MPFRASVHVLLYCTFPCSGYAATPQFHHGCFLPVLHSGHQVLLLSSFDIFSPTIVSFLPYFVYLTLLPTSLFLYFHASRQLLYYTFLSFSLETKSCSWFSSVLVLLQSHPPHPTNVTTSYLIFQPFPSNAVLLGGIPHVLLYFYAFLHKKCISLSSCCAFCGLTTCAASSLLLLSFSTFIFEHSHLKCPTPQHLKYLIFPTISFLLVLTSSLTPHCITLLAITSNLFWGVSFPFISSFLFLQLQARYLNLLHSQHTLLSLLSISALSLVRAYHCLSIPLMRELYCSRDMMLHFQRSQIRNDVMRAPKWK